MFIRRFKFLVKITKVIIVNLSTGQGSSKSFSCYTSEDARHDLWRCADKYFWCVVYVVLQAFVSSNLFSTIIGVTSHLSTRKLVHSFTLLPGTLFKKITGMKILSCVYHEFNYIFQALKFYFICLTLEQRNG